MDFYQNSRRGLGVCGVGADIRSGFEGFVLALNEDI